MAQALYRKWRPQTFAQVVGQEHITQTLRNALASGRVGHAYLFAGLRGTGKTTMARLVAKAVNCLAEDLADRPCNACAVCEAVSEGRFLDLIEIDAASHTGVDDVRELRDKVGFRPNVGRFKVYIIDEVHRFSGSAFDALLKTIEEPPEHAIFVLATTEIHKIPATILSRCQRFDFRRIPVQQITRRLGKLAEAEGINAEPEALTLIAHAATGSLRDAESLLDQLAAANLGGITLAQVQATLGTIDAELVTKLVGSLVARDFASGLGFIDQALDQGADLRQFARQIVNHLRGMLLIRLQGSELLDVSAESLQVMAAQAEQIETPVLVEAIKRFSQVEAELRGGWQPQLPLELALVEAIMGPGMDASPPVASRSPGVRVARDSDQAHPQLARTRAPAPPPEPQSPSPAEDQCGVSDGLTLEAVQQRWPQILERARARDASVQALLNSAHPGEVQGERVTLFVAHEFARDRLSQGRAKRMVKEVLSQVLGQNCRVAYQVVATSDEASSFAVPPNEVSSVKASLPGRSHSQQRDAWDDDPVVQAARQLGAEVRPIDEGRDK